jgi:hypothetical protein
VARGAGRSKPNASREVGVSRAGPGHTLRLATFRCLLPGTFSFGSLHFVGLIVEIISQCVASMIPVPSGFRRSGLLIS